MLEAGSCEGCMRACWIDTSHMFRTLAGFVETAKLTLSSRPSEVADIQQANQRGIENLQQTREACVQLRQESERLERQLGRFKVD